MFEIGEVTPDKQLCLTRNVEVEACGVADGAQDTGGVILEAALMENPYETVASVVHTAIRIDEFHGLRITPNVYTTLDEVDRFGDKVLEAIARGVNV